MANKDTSDKIIGFCSKKLKTFAHVAFAFTAFSKDEVKSMK
jgi:hypothetical protein